MLAQKEAAPMSQSNKKEKIPESVTQGSVKSTLVSFVIAVIYGIVAAVGFASGREMLETIVNLVVYGNAEKMVNVSNVAGYRHLGIIISISVMAIAWLSTFMIVWYKAEHAPDMAKRVQVGVKWVIGAIVFIFITSVIVFAISGHWPSLRGGV